MSVWTEGGKKKRPDLRRASGLAVRTGLGTDEAKVAWAGSMTMRAVRRSIYDFGVSLVRVPPAAALILLHWNQEIRRCHPEEKNVSHYSVVPQRCLRRAPCQWHVEYCPVWQKLIHNQAPYLSHAIETAKPAARTHLAVLHMISV